MISDTTVRNAIRSEKTRSVVVEASAGTGKTTLLTDRVKELVESGIPLENLAVVTFTEHAASELRQRIREKLKPQHKKAMDQAWITTIHGFASRILREYFHLCGGTPDFSVEHTHFSRSELEIHWDLFLAEADPSVLRSSSESLQYPGSKDLLDIAEKIEKHRWFTGPEPLGNTKQALDEMIHYQQLQLETLVLQCSNSADKLKQDILKSIESLKTGEAVKVNLRGGSAGNWGGKQILCDAKSVLKVYNNRGVKLTGEYTTMLGRLPAVEGLVVPFANKLRSVWDHNPTRLSFSDLLYKAWRAVAESSELREELGKKFGCIFIDEFQDTSLVQIKLFSELLGKVGLAKKLTVVGDPKQSIFGWRDADIETYKDTLNSLEASGALMKTIEVNFRSETSIVNFVNWFGNALFCCVPPDEKPFSCSYSPIQPRPGAGEGEGVTVHRLPVMDADPMSAMEASAIADIITNPGKTAVLFRTKTHLDALVQELNSRQIPYQVEAARDFHEREEVKDTANLLRAVLCPADLYALVNTFRSIYFGISDKDISLWRLGRKPASVIQAETLLAKLRKIARSAPPGIFMETLFRNTSLLPAVKKSEYQVTRRLGNLRFILETAHNIADYSLLLETLLGQSPQSTEEPSSPPESAQGVVTLTTIHGAKGLAWDHVILVNPGGRSYHRPPAVLVNDRDLTAGIKTAGGSTAHYDALLQREQARNRAEFRRLLYVAVTRPRRKLDIFLPETAAVNSPAGVLSSALAQSSGMFRDVPVPVPEEAGNRPEHKIGKLSTDADDFTLVYPESIPEVQAERERQMRFGSEVHSILEFIDFENPQLWVHNNRESLSDALEFPEQAAVTALKFFEIFNLNGVKILGREYPLLVNGRQYYIDLLLERNGALEIVDYKTDKGDPVSKTGEYRKKQLLYKNTLEKLTGSEVTAKLVFLHHGVVVTVQESPKEKPPDFL
jgi:ATP-dependent helicase/nuclease subunit A